MRFSLKWALVAMAYTALAAAALSAPSVFFDLSLWSVAAVSFIYAALVAIAARGKLRVLALGFALSQTVYCVCLYTIPNRTPWYPMFESSLRPGATSVHRISEYQRLSKQLQSPKSGRRPTFVSQIEDDYVQALRHESVNAIGAMAAGLIGYGLGALAYRRAQRDASTVG